MDGSSSDLSSPAVSITESGRLWEPSGCYTGYTVIEQLQGQRSDTPLEDFRP